jgi:sugar lactone lactonase YvrE
LLASGLLLATFALLPAAASAETPTPVFVQTFGSLAQPLESPNGVAVVSNGEAKGDVWVANTASDQLLEFSKEGKFLRAAGEKGSGEGQLSSPEGIAVDSEGDVWVADSDNNRIDEFSPTGHPMGAVGQEGYEAGKLDFPQAVAIDSSGNLWTVDGDFSHANYRVQEFKKEASGKYVFSHVFGKRGHEEEQFFWPRGIAVGEGHVWVADSVNSRVSEYTEAGQPLRQITGNSVADIALDGNGHVWVSDSAPVIKEYGSSETPLLEFGRQGHGSGEFESPQSIAVGPEGEVWVADAQNERLQEFSPKGAFMRQVDSPHEVGKLLGAWGVSTTHEGNVWVADYGNHYFQEFNEKGEFLAQLGIEGGFGKGGFLEPTDLAEEPNGEIWAVDGGLFRIPHVENFKEMHLGEFSFQAELSIYPEHYGSAEGDVKCPRGAAADSEGHLFVADYCNDHIDEYQGSTLIAQIGAEGSGEGQLKTPTWVAIDPRSGNLVVTDQGNNRIVIFKKGDGGKYEYLSSFGSKGTGNGQFEVPQGVAVDEQGDVWVADDDNHRVEEFVPNQNALGGYEYATQFGAEVGEGQLGSPWGLAVYQGNIYVADEGTARVDKWQIPPSNTQLPTISGTAEVGQTLTANPGVWQGARPLSFSYEWQRCNTEGKSCSAIPGATGENPSYIVGQEDYGKTLRVSVTAENAAGSESEDSAPTSTVVAFPPHNTVPPTVTGTPLDGDTLSANHGLWAGSPPISYSYQWQRCSPEPVTTSFGAGELGLTGSLALGENGTVWQVRGNEVVKYNALGEEELAVEPDKAVTRLGTIAVANGHLWIADVLGARIEEYDEEGHKLRTVFPEREPYGIATSKGKVYFTAYRASEGLSEVESFGETESTPTFTLNVDSFAESGGEPIPASEPGQFNFHDVEPVGIAVTPSGDIWITDPTQDRVEEFTEDGRYEREIGPEGEHGLFFEADAIATDGHGDLWVADAGSQEVSEFNEDGKLEKQFGTESLSSGDFEAMHGVAVDSAGHIWISSPIQEYDESGTPTLTGGCTDIATGETYALASGDVGSVIDVAVTASNPQGKETVTSAASGTVIASGAPVSETVPTITGSTQVGQRLSASQGTWLTEGPTSYEYQWESCNAGGGECAPVEEATDSEYELSAGDEGATLRAKVTAKNSAGSQTATSTTTGVIVAEPIGERQAPTISGVPDEHSVLSANGGQWMGAAGTELYYQWESCNSGGNECAPIEGATEPDYELGEGDVGNTVRIRMGASSPLATLSDLSTVSPVVGSVGALASEAPPTITGIPQVSIVNEVLTAEPGKWFASGEVTFEYQWQSCNEFGGECEDIKEHATEETYGISSGEVGHAVRVVVTAHSGGHSVSRASAATQPVPEPEPHREHVPPVAEQAPTVSGAALVGQRLSATTGSWSAEGSPSFSYKWERCATAGHCTAITGAVASSYVLTTSDLDSTVLAVVTATSAPTNASAVSAPSAIVQPESLGNFVSPSVVGAVSLGTSLTAELGVWSGVGPVSYKYQWERCKEAECSAISGAKESTYPVVSSDLNDTLRVKVTLKNPLGEKSATSATTIPVFGGELSTEAAEESAAKADPSLLAPSTTATIEEESVVPGLTDEESELGSHSTLTHTLVSKEAPGAFAVNSPIGELSVVPLETASVADTNPTIVNGDAALFANTEPATDTIVRPEALGASAVLELRSAEAPKTFAWEVHAGADQQLRQLASGAVAVVDVGEREREPIVNHPAAQPTAAGKPVSEPTETASEETERHEAEEAPPMSEAEEEEEPPLSELPSAPHNTLATGEPIAGQPKPQDTTAEYEAERTAVTSAEEAAGSSALMVIAPPTVVDAAGSTVPASLRIVGNHVVLTVYPSKETAYPTTAMLNVAAPTDKVSAERDPFEYGLADDNPKTFTEMETTPSHEKGVLANLKRSHLSIKAARLIIPWNVWSTHTHLRGFEVEEQKEGRPTEFDRLQSWLANVQALPGIHPVITLEPPRKCRGTECHPTASAYQKALEELIENAPGVTKWGAWNEPDANPKTSFLAKGPGRAAEYWEAAQTAVTRQETRKHCEGCEVIAGEFALNEKKEERNEAYPAAYIRCYEQIVIKHHCVFNHKTQKSAGLWHGSPPRIWGFHDYHDPLHKAHGEYAEKIIHEIRGMGLKTPQLWITESAVELQDGRHTTTLVEGSPTENKTHQKEAAEEFLKLHEPTPGHYRARITGVFYFDYRQPSDSERKSEPNRFDSGLLNANAHEGAKPPEKEVKGGPREAYCVIVVDGCSKPRAQTEKVRQVSANSGLLPAKLVMPGEVDPNGLPTTYRFEWGKDTVTEFHSEWKEAGEGVSPVPVARQLFNPEVEGWCGTPATFRVVATNAEGTEDGTTEPLLKCPGA